MNKTEYLRAEVDTLRREVQSLRADLATVRGLLEAVTKEGRPGGVMSEKPDGFMTHADLLALVWKIAPQIVPLVDDSFSWAEWAASRRPVQAAPQWQPIATAPKDGTSILGSRRGARAVHAFYWSTGEWWPEFSPDRCRWQPTHWMPLPAGVP